ncbi:MAG: YicC family protein [Muribaculaceae bacterium]|nr:YicC family protein [Muribaculaceae bacterium]
MLMSMTGFGKATAETKTHRISAEIKSLNSKQLDLSVRLPYIFRESELEVRGIVGHTIERGKADLLVTCENLPDAATALPSELNVEVMSQYKKQIESAAEQLGISVPEDLFRTLMTLPESMRTSVPEAGEGEVEILRETVSKAVERLMAHRRAEGLELESFFRVRIEAIGDLLRQIEPFEQERVPRIRQRLEDALSKIPAVEFDKGRLEQEMIFYIEKLDVNEEKQRLAKHLSYFLETIDSPKPGQGKKLGFISQEIGREINTLGSKSNHAEMQAIVVKMKDLLEQIKEQVLNVM